MNSKIQFSKNAEKAKHIAILFTTIAVVLGGVATYVVRNEALENGYSIMLSTVPAVIITVVMFMVFNFLLKKHELLCVSCRKSLVKGGKWKESNSCPTCGVIIWDEA